MNCPKYIQKLLDKREKAAYDFNSADSEIADWLEKNEIWVEDYHIRGGCESLACPSSSKDAILRAIENK